MKKFFFETQEGSAAFFGFLFGLNVFYIVTTNNIVNWIAAGVVFAFGISAQRSIFKTRQAEKAMHERRIAALTKTRDYCLENDEKMVPYFDNLIKQENKAYKKEI